MSDLKRSAKITMKLLGCILAISALWFGFAALGVLVDKSDHMGSRVRNAERWGQWESRLNDTSLNPDEKQYWLSELRKVMDGGIKGYDLLFDTTINLGISSLIMGLSSMFIIVLNTQKKRTEPNQRE
jgi:hypothetical protein